ncbi:MAG: hypothetical protein DSY55_00790 [Clostridia bacterium]|nr:MAG: hypothetical protein DSY55_00790 [Clostridia bacterium]
MVKTVKMGPALAAVFLLAAIITCAPPALPTPDGATGSLSSSPTPTSTPEASISVASPTPGPVPRQDLTGQIWQLNGYVTTAGEVEKALNGAPSTIQFDEDGRFSGNTGCNSFFGVYKLDGKALSLDVRGVTLRACTVLQADQETAILNALKKIQEYQIQENSLTLLDANGVVFLSYFLLPNSKLIGTAWHLTALNSGKSGMISNLVTERIAMTLDNNNQVSGNAGCNNYFGSYQIHGESLTFGVIAATEMACPEPEGVMETESAFLDMLSKVKNYEIQGEKLAFFEKNGVKLANFKNK